MKRCSPYRLVRVACLLQKMARSYRLRRRCLFAFSSEASRSLVSCSSSRRSVSFACLFSVFRPRHATCVSFACLSFVLVPSLPIPFVSFLRLVPLVSSCVSSHLLACPPLPSPFHRLVPLLVLSSRHAVSFYFVSALFAFCFVDEMGQDGHAMRTKRADDRAGVERWTSGEQHGTAHNTPP